jgi:glycolate oxidase
MALKHASIEKLQAIVGQDHCSTAREDLACYAYDATAETYWPDAVVFPKQTAEVAAVLRLANQEGFYIVPRGSGSGMTGGALAVQGGVVMVMTRFNRILAIDTENMIARAEPGVITRDLHAAVERLRLFYPPDPSSSDFSTLGGNLAECAGGPRAVKYGVTRDYVLGLEVVLPTGEIIHTGVQTAKGVVGYDLTRLMVGSEGTLGVITQMTLRLLPLPEAVGTLSAIFDRMETAAETVVEIFRSGIVPRSMEFMDNASLRCVERYLKIGLPETAGALLLIDVDGRQAEITHELERIQQICRTLGALKAERATSPAEAADLWRARKAISPALFQEGRDKINEDIVVPRNQIPAMIRKIEAIQQATGLKMVSFGHAGDGNIHVNIMLDKRDPEALRKAMAAVETIFDYTLALGGTISGEHGVGITKAPYLPREIGPTEQNVMGKIKKLFDPRGILNPGKLFPGHGTVGGKGYEL